MMHQEGAMMHQERSALILAVLGRSLQGDQESSINGINNGINDDKCNNM